MMINFIIVLAIVAIGAWLGNILMTVEQRVSQARQRVRGVRNNLDKLDATIHRLHREEESLHAEIEEMTKEVMELRKKQVEVQQRLTEAQSKRRPQMLILTDRRNPGDKEWLVTVVNQQIGEIDAAHPLAVEWARGREYLVWAESDREAAERANRRFSARPGYQVRSVTPVKGDLYTANSARSAA
ncbi:cell division septum initiation protein DivIVA [Azospirillum lipoferum]|uniref:Uncharacterized protein n=1 Tax=Azospirillum lipoferum TaxID=193 RepID=A0A5A9GX44_AZOLI|nr:MULTISPECIES: hypothetical protein [Azospirillum]KAA0598823.1 hypothetical protein FZ942_07085 [Azospirillum lipoferum]MCP1609142.1 cell division septum initiation protein DivIVA [Azospirillum lipoferum]MDW5535548.1 hypothetical protein [Azospirillum sp. NL1]